MIKTVFHAILTGIVCLLASGCMKEPERIFIKDPLNIGKSLSDALEEECGLYVAVNSVVSSTGEFNKHSLLIYGEVKGHLDTRISTLGMSTTNDFLFRDVNFIYVASGGCSTSTDEPCDSKIDTVEWANYKIFPREFRTYRNERTLSKLFIRKYVNSSDFIFLMKKSKAKRFSNLLKEVIVEY